jgi:diguanylate cyclase (GGDEF)-like protein/PAS domain S-box-containing protein
LLETRTKIVITLTPEDVINSPTADPDQLRQLHEHILQSVSDGVHVVDVNGIVLIENAASAKMLGWCGDCLVGKHGHMEIHHHHADLTEHALADCPIYATIMDGQTRHIKDDVFWRQNGTSFPVEYTTAPLRNDHGVIYGATVVFRDVTELKEAQARLLRMAQYCPLTDLPNRALFSDRLQLALALAKRNQAKLALLFIDLDEFKPINDTLGHAMGDALLQVAAQRMSACVRNSDTVARLGGDEFVVLLPVVEGPADALAVAEKIRRALNETFELDGNVVQISASMGVAIYPDHGVDELILTKNADLAMYAVKAHGRNGVRLAVTAGQ